MKNPNKPKKFSSEADVISYLEDSHYKDVNVFTDEEATRNTAGTKTRKMDRTDQ